MTLRHKLAALAAQWGLEGLEADPDLLATCLVEQGKWAALASLLEEALRGDDPEERCLAREYDAALDCALCHDPVAEWQDEMFCNCSEEARGEAFDGCDL